MRGSKKLEYVSVISLVSFTRKFSVGKFFKVSMKR